MKRLTKYILLFLIIGLQIGCADEKLKEKIYRQKIQNGAIIKKIDLQRGDFELVYIDSLIQDTIPIYRFHLLFDQIDSLTTISKDSNSFKVNFRNLKKGQRYSETIELIYW